MNEYRQNAIEHLKTHLGCVGYRDYLIAELEKLDKIKQIVKQVESLHPEVAIGDREGIRKIKEVLEQDN